MGSKVDTAHAVSQLPRQPSVEEMTDDLPPMLTSIYNEHGVVPTDELLVPSLLQNPGHNQKTISRALQKQRAIKFWPSEEIEASTLSTDDQVKLSRSKSIKTLEARAWQTILPGQHELPSSTWCMWIQVWLGAPVYDLPIHGHNLNCHTCGKFMDRFGRHALGTCGTGFGRTARHNRIMHVLREEALVQSGIPSRREEIGLFPGADDRPGDIYVTNDAGCTDAGYTSAAFDFTVHGAMPDNGKSSPLLISSSKIPGAAAHDAEKSKISNFLRREREVALVLETDKGITWKRDFQFRPFAMDVFGALGPEAKKAVSQFSNIRASRFNQSAGSCRRKILQAINVALISTNAKMLSCRRPQFHISLDAPASELLD